MKTTTSFSLVLLITLITCSFAASTFKYSFSTTTSPLSYTYAPIYSLGILNAGFTVSVTVSVQGYAVSAYTIAPNSFDVIQVEDINTSTPIAGCTTNTSPNVYTYIIVCLVPTTTAYRLRVIKNNSPSSTAGSVNPKVFEHFHLLVTQYNSTGNLAVGNTN